MDTTIALLFLGILIVFSAFFSAAEMAFSTLNRIKLKNMAAGGDKRAIRTLKLAEHYDKLLSTVLIGNNIVNIASSALCTVLLVSLFGSKGASLATIIMTVAILLFGEISPKTLAKESPEQVALFFTPFLQFFVVILSPLNILAGFWRICIIRLFRVKSNRSITEAELLTFVEEARQDGGINENEEQMIRRTIEFDEVTAGDILTPRIDVDALSIKDPPSVIEKKFRDTGFSRLPVYNESIDDIIGVLLLKDFFCIKKPVTDLIKPTIFITKTIKIAKLLVMLQEKKCHLAVVVDEFGGTVGIVTVEDIIEELVGEIWDEHDEIVEPVTKITENHYRIRGSTSLEEIEELFPGILPDYDYNSTTVGGWVMEQSGGIPKEGDSFQLNTVVLTVSKVVHRRVLELVLSPAAKKQ
ncbi:MAG: hemolysin family protein [Spirochaetaceae bacterium]|jgi:CBS domain containing-hemolysin-like protein|nr:hemolysin family protein [Spirochaetaceae bacterium]